MTLTVAPHSHHPQARLYALSINKHKIYNKMSGFYVHFPKVFLSQHFPKASKTTLNYS